ncbi:MAG: hypothetical protein ACE5FT_06030 [Candidatus Nanoarchaeia archaeon]
MKITIDTKDDKHELIRIIQLLQHIVDGSFRSNEPVSTYSSVEEPQVAPSPGIFNLFNDDAPKSLSPPSSDDGSDDEDLSPGIQIVDF